MSLKIGIVGLPNVGKSTLFNSLTNNKVPAENYPFCTIDPNIGVVPVIDFRIDKLSEMSNSKKKIYATVEFVDIAGIVEGASKGEGLGNKFLSEIMEVDAIVQVVRIFENQDILHVSQKIDPKRDIEVINTELILKDIEILDKYLLRITKEVRVNTKYTKYLEFLQTVRKSLDEGILARIKIQEIIQMYSEDEIFKFEYKQLQLLTNKPFLYLANVSESDINLGLDTVIDKLGLNTNENVIVISVKLEYEISQISGEDKILFMDEYKMSESGLDKLIKKAYKMLGLLSYFTTGEDETRAWTITVGMNARESAGVIHTDFTQKFIAAEVMSYDDFVQFNGKEGCKTNGKLRLESKEYIVKDGDVIEFRVGK